MPNSAAALKGACRSATALPTSRTQWKTTCATWSISVSEWSTTRRSTTRIHSNKSGLASAGSEYRSVCGMTSSPIVLPMTWTRLETARSCRSVESRWGAISYNSSEKYSVLRLNPAIPYRLETTPGSQMGSRWIESSAAGMVSAYLTTPAQSPTVRTLMPTMLERLIQDESGSAARGERTASGRSESGRSRSTAASESATSTASPHRARRMSRTVVRGVASASWGRSPAR